MLQINITFAPYKTNAPIAGGRGTEGSHRRAVPMTTYSIPKIKNNTNRWEITRPELVEQVVSEAPTGLLLCELIRRKQRDLDLLSDALTLLEEVQNEPT